MENQSLGKDSMSESQIKSYDPKEYMNQCLSE